MVFLRSKVNTLDSSAMKSVFSSISVLMRWMVFLRLSSDRFIRSAGRRDVKKR